MPTFDDDFIAAAQADHLDLFGETVTVEMPDQSPREVTAIVDDNVKREDDGQQHKKDLEEIDVYFKRDATDGIVETKRGMTVTRASNPQKSYRFQQILEDQPAGITCRFVHGTIRDYGNPKTDL